MPIPESFLDDDHLEDFTRDPDARRPGAVLSVDPDWDDEDRLVDAVASALGYGRPLPEVV